MDINYRDWIQLTDLIFDQKIVPAEAVLVHGFDDLRDEMIDFVADLYKNSGARFVVLNGESEYELGSPGFNYWKKKLVEHGIPESSISGITPARQTHEEAVEIGRAHV